MFVLLLSAGFVSAAAAFEFRKYILADAGSAVALVTVALLGPLPAVCAYAAGESIYLLRDYRPGRQPLASISNLALVGWSALVAWIPLAAFGYTPPVDSGIGVCVLLAIGGGLTVVLNWAMLIVNGIFYDGQRLATLATSSIVNLSADVFLIAGSIVTVLAYGAVGTPALSLLGLLILLPRLLAPLIYRSRPINQLDPSEATQQYARLIAIELKVSRQRQSIMLDAAAQLGGRARLTAVDSFNDVMQLVLYSNERWDGRTGGFPGVLSGGGIPIESRILAVARTWADLTAKGTQEMSPEQAAHALRAAAGAELDPVVVAAAQKILEDELVPASLQQRTALSRALGASEV